MQEHVEESTVTLVIHSARLTASVLREAVGRYLAYRGREETGTVQDGSVNARGKQSVRSLMGQNEPVDALRLETASIRDFDRIARKYHVDYGTKRVHTPDAPAWMVFFRARDRKVLEAALTEYRSLGRRDPEKIPDILSRLRAPTPPGKEKTLARPVPER